MYDPNSRYQPVTEDDPFVGAPAEIPAQRFAPDGHTAVGLPVRAFLFTLDQVAYLLSMDLKSLRQRYVWFEGKMIGAHNRDKLLARDIGVDQKDWRVAEAELVRWCRRKGFHVYDTGWAQSG